MFNVKIPKDSKRLQLLSCKFFEMTNENGEAHFFETQTDCQNYTKKYANCKW